MLKLKVPHLRPLLKKHTEQRTKNSLHPWLTSEFPLYPKMPRILLTNHYPDSALHVIRALLPAGFEVVELEKPGRTEILRLAPLADFLLVGGRVNIDSEILNAAPNLKLIQRTGVGLDSLDLAAIRARGIPICVNSGINARSVAEHTILLILAVLRRINEIDASVNRREWRKHEFGITCHDLHGKTVGLIGLGAIGMHVAEMLQPFGVSLLCHKPSPLPQDTVARLGIRQVALEELLRQSDIISLLCPLNADTRGIINEDRVAMMKHGVVLINTARGPLIEEAALANGLASGKILGAGLDVFPVEPIPQHSSIPDLPNIILTPHMAGLTIETFEGMMRAALSNIVAFHNGGIGAATGILPA
jgi:D-3-phosphoglycerate dehydrogenase